MIMAEAVKVIVRCRPMNNRELNLGCKDILSIVNNLAQCSIRNPNDDKAPPKSFTFDGAYDKSSAMEEIYADIGFPLVEGVVEGYNGTIFAYGQTGSGKSYSMQGVSDPPANRGIIPRAFDHIFETIQVSEGSKYLVHASYLEIYNEEVRDLLGKDIKQRLELKEHPDKGVYVMGLSMHPCGKVSDCEKIMEKGWSNRSTGATLMNADSSRSHSIFSIHLERSDTNDNGEQHIRAAKLNLVDLAGSERQGKTGATGDRLKEATKINLSLSALGNVISALVDGKSTHIPYRDSKLTRLLQDSLGGNTKTLMVACLSPADNNYDETLSTLRYANRAKNIKNKPKINEDPKDAMLREYQDEINKLKAMLRGEIPVQIDGSTSTVAHKRSKASPPGITKEEVEKEKKALREEFEKEMRLMKEELLSVKASKEETEQKMAQLGNEFEHRMKDISEAAPLINQESFIQEEVPIGNKQKDRKQLVPSEQMRKLSRADVQQISFQAREGGQETSEPVENVNSNSSEALLRLQELEQKMVGGELANNEEVKERRRKKKKHAEERTRKLQEALLRKDGDEIMIDIYESVHDKLRAVNKKLELEMNKSESLQREITDLQSEFEFDRIDYLNTIRRQEEQILWFQAVVDRIHPLVRSGCNYGNLDRIRSLSKWDETNRQWTLPKVTMEDVQLPVSGGDAVTEYRENRIDGNRRMSSFESNGTNQMDRYKMKLESSEGQQIANNYFKNNRAEELLHRVSLPSKGMNGSLPNFLAGRPSMVAEMDDGMSWKPPTRLEALPVSAPSKHSSKKPNRKL